MTENSSVRLHILCAHEPNADPRIDWTAVTALEAGYDVRVLGWLGDRDQPENAPARPYRLERFNEASPRVGRGPLAAGALGIVPAPMLAGLAVLGGLLAILWLPFLLVKTAWRTLDRILERFGFHVRTTRAVGRRLRALRAALFWRVNDWTRGAAVRLWTGLVDYRWYFVRHAGGYAAAYLRWLEDNPELRPEVIHANDPDALLAGALAKRIYSVRLVYDAHEYGPDAYILHTTPRALFFLYEGMLVRRADGAVTVSPQIAKRFNERYRGRPEFKALPNASPILRDLRPQDCFSLDTMAKGRVRVLYQGGFAANRGLEQIIDDWREVDDSRAALFFRGPDNDFRKILVAHAEGTGRLGQSIFFLPSVAEDDLTAAAMGADIGLIPYLSHVENHQGACPNKLGQYMQAGLAIMSAPLPFVRSILEEAQCGVVYDDAAVGEFAVSLQALLDDPDRVRRLGAAGVWFAREHYNFGSYFPTLEALYRPDREPGG